MVYIIIDFDSTFMQVEALEELGEIVLKNPKEKATVLQEIKDITNLGMEGKLSFHESLTKRMDLLTIHRTDVEKLVKRLRKKVSVSFSRNKAFFKKYKGQIYIISSGFKDFIVPVVAPYEIEAGFVLANTFTYDEAGWVTGFDRNNPLAFSKGKPKVLQQLNLDGEIWVIGDGYTDYEMVEAGIAHKFFAFTENVLRESLLDKAHHVTPSFDEFLFVNRMPRALSYPKNRIGVVLERDIPAEAAAQFRDEGYQVEVLEAPLTEEALRQRASELSILGVLPGTFISPSFLASAGRLMAVGVLGAGGPVRQVGPVAAAQGVALFDAPYTHTRAQAEMVLAQMIFLLRGPATWTDALPDSRPSYELRGKTLGIVGYGHSGQQLSILAEALGMEVLYADLDNKPALGNARQVGSLTELVRMADVISLHLDHRPENKDLFNAATLRRMPSNAVLLNFSNGEAIDLPALASLLESGKFLGAALDTLPSAPTGQQLSAIARLRQIPRVRITPGIGGDTVESRLRAASFVPARLIEYVNTGATHGSLNFPELQLPVLKDAHRLIHIHLNRPGILAQINNILAEHRINILGQYLKTNDQIGYAITDIDKRYSKKVLNELKRIEHTIKFRTLY